MNRQDESMTGAAPQACRWHPVADQQALPDVASETIVACAARAIEQRGRFDIVLAGGNTPRAVYERLRDVSSDWSRWRIYFGDERCLPPLDPARNSRMAGDAWLDRVPIRRSQVHAIPGELGAVHAADEYADLLRSVGTFDLVLLGLGEDGHTASLFPDHEWGSAPGSPDTLAVFDAPKPPAQRVSLSAARLARSRQVVFLVSGEAKRRAVTAWRAGQDIPARAIAPAAGVDVLVESALLSPPAA
ncbi:6-phosphogluconolactonase [Accumulibacter sp.]|uniref:6-phosphogluconolactonase n=1 Tax=Accumulibacter sp. TaxID=2053492 RepID=UPI0026193957|nr:6-phosphogluconolactonase [Accumulibacter sp.]